MLPVADLVESLGEQLKVLGTSSTRYALVGSAFLYLFGYLALRFHLTTIGLGSDLPVFDERYVFTGASFLVYVAAAVPGIVLVGLPFFFAGWLLSRVLPASAREALIQSVTAPGLLIPFGIVFSVLVIQLVMSPCFRFTDLLLGRELPTHPAWYATLMYENGLMQWYFGGLVATCVVPIGILVLLRSRPDINKFGYGLLAFLAVVQAMLLPINYGVLVVDKSLPRVAALGDKPLTSTQTAWLIWQERGSVTYLVRDSTQDQRSLLTVKTDGVPQTQIVGYDEIVPTLFGGRYVRGRYHLWRLRQGAMQTPAAQPQPAQPPATEPPAAQPPAAQPPVAEPDGALRPGMGSRQDPEPGARRR